MKNVLLISFLLACTGAFAQHKKSCCEMPIQKETRALAMNAAFAKSHLEPLPFHLPEPRGKMVYYKSADGKSASAYEVKGDKESNKFLFVFHEWWGLNDYIKQEAETMQKELGDVTVYAIDLYDGKVAATVADAQRYVSDLRDDRCRNIINGTIEMVKEKAPNAQIATLGWCMGGTWSMQAALLAKSNAVACVMYYGMPEKDQSKLNNLNCDVLGIFGTEDKFINPETVNKFKAQMKTAKKKLIVENYKADHAFANPSNPKFNREFAADAYQKSIKFLKAHLK